MDAELIEAYLRRIGATRPDRPDLAGLRQLQERHVLTVPFENLDYHFGTEIVMDERVLDKVVRQRRGGGCYETNPALAYLLAEFGYQVEILPGRVYRPGGVVGPFLCHLALRVHVEGEDRLVDVGFGRNSRHPLRFDTTEPQPDPHGEYVVRPADDGGHDVLLNGKPLYRVDDRPVRIEDFGPTLWWWRTSPDSPFLQDLFCTIATEHGRITLKGDQLTRVDGTDRVTEHLADDDAVLTAYDKYFGISLDAVPRNSRASGRTTGVQLD